MKVWAAALVLVVGWQAAGQEIHLKTRTIQANSGAAATPTGASHQIIQFDHSPSPEDLDNLLSDGHPVLSALPDNTVVVAAPDGPVTPRDGIRWIGSLDPANKISAAFAGMADPVTAIIEFHADVDAATQDRVGALEGLTFQRVPALMANHALATASMVQLQALATHDEVAYIFPADSDLAAGSPFSACAGMLTLAGPIAQYANIVHGWDFDSDHMVHLNYVFGSLTTKVPPATVQSEIVRAFSEWSKYTNVTFQPATSASAARTVVVRFASGAHGDAYPFDGPGGVLAHTFYPVPVNPEPIAGDMHLDADENWHAGADPDIYSVALHEAGHALGLGHSDNPGDVMYPYYRTGMHLSANDIGAVQSLYGVLSTTSSNSSAPVVSTPVALPLRLSLDPTASTSAATRLSLTGTLSGGSSPWAVQWQTDHGFSGQASVSGSAWMATGITLVPGSNTITVTAFDGARHTATQTVVIVCNPPAAITTASPAPGSTPASSAPVSVAISSPSSSVTTVSTSTLTIGGTAAGGSGIVKVTWQTSSGASGAATGTQHWIAQNVPLLTGTNTIVIKAWDANGATGWAAIVAVRR